MDEKPVSVLIVDDSALMRNLIGRIIENNPGLTLVGKAMNGQFALQKISRLDPDILVLDLEMPEMNGIEFLKERRRLGINVPVVILSSLARKGAQVTMEALALGASDFIMKPSGSISEDIHTVGTQLVEMLLAYGRQYRRSRGGTSVTGRQENRPTTPSPINPFPNSAVRASVPSNRKDSEKVEEFSPGTMAQPPRRDFPKLEPIRTPGPVEIIAIGISTGGPNALREVFARLDPDLNVPVVVVQHMPPGFTEEFAKSLDRICPLEVKEAQEGDLVKPGRILIAPGDRHIIIEKRPLATVARILDTPSVNGHRPSADVLFQSVAAQFMNRSLALIMTGMGRDGARQIGSIYREGGMTVAQDEHSCIVFGMPKVAIENGYIHRIVSLSEMSATINSYVKESRQYSQG